MRTSKKRRREKEKSRRKPWDTSQRADNDASGILQRKKKEVENEDCDRKVLKKRCKQKIVKEIL